MSLYEAIQFILQKLRERQFPDDIAKNIWEEIVIYIACNNTLSNQYCKLIELEISEYISTLDENDKRSIWKETEVGQWNQDSINDIHIDSIIMDLEVGIFDEIAKYAWKIAGDVRKNKMKIVKKRA